MQKAIDAVRSKNLRTSEAASQFNIPLSTLYCRIAGRRGSSRRGAPTILSTKEEAVLVNVIELFDKWQLPLVRQAVIEIGRAYMLELGKRINPSSTLNEWFYGFMKRHPQLKTMELNNIDSVSCTPEAIKHWFEKLHQALVKCKLLDRPNAIFNIYESGFSDEAPQLSVVVKRATTYPISSHSGIVKSYKTVFMCANANGKVLPPHIIHKSAVYWNAWFSQNGYRETRFNESFSEWVEEHIFFDWFHRQFVPYVKDIPKPVLLIVDGHKAHISIRIIKTAMEHGIKLLSLPPNSTTILQPFHALALTEMKAAWQFILNEHNTQTNSTTIDKESFSSLIGELWQNHLRPNHFSSGFSRSGIFPFNPSVVIKEKILVPPTTQFANGQFNANAATIPNAKRTFRLIRSASCGVISIEGLNGTTTPVQTTSFHPSCDPPIRNSYHMRCDYE